MLQIINGKSNDTTLVFLHGYLLSSEQWSNLALHRAPWRSVLIDLPYHGKNIDVQLDETNLESYADFVLNEIRNAGIEHYSLVGHSMGGYIGLLMMQKDQNLQKLVLLHSNIWEDSTERKKNRERVADVVKRSKTLFLKESLPLLFKNKHKHNTTILSLIQEASGMSAEGIVHGALAMRDRLNQFELVRKNKNRCFFIQGSHDALIPIKEAQKIWKEYSDMNYFFTIPDCGHMSHFERPRSLKTILTCIVGII